MTLFLDEYYSGSVGRLGIEGLLQCTSRLTAGGVTVLCPWARHYLVHGYMGAVSGAGVYFVSNPELWVEI